jgi:hypothetical protein
MPLFFFHLENHPSWGDREGTELPDVEAAKAHAVRLAGELIRDSTVDSLEAPWRLHVTDESDNEVLCLAMSALEGERLRGPRDGDG